MAQQTTLGPWGVSFRTYGTFAGKTEAEVIPPQVTGGAGPKKRKEEEPRPLPSKILRMPPRPKPKPPTPPPLPPAVEESQLVTLLAAIAAPQVAPPTAEEIGEILAKFTDLLQQPMTERIVVERERVRETLMGDLNALLGRVDALEGDISSLIDIILLLLIE